MHRPASSAAVLEMVWLRPMNSDCFVTLEPDASFSFFMNNGRLRSMPFYLLVLFKKINPPYKFCIQAPLHYPSVVQLSPECKMSDLFFERCQFYEICRRTIFQMMFARDKNTLLTTYRNGALPSAWLDELFQKKSFKLFVPVRYGGLELDLDEGLQHINDAAAVHGSLGWVVNLGAGAGYFWPFLDHKTAEEIFSPENAVIAGSGAATGVARRVKGGYQLTGAWDKCSGAAHAAWFTVNATLQDGQVRSFAVPRKNVSVTPSWKLFALKATSSYAIEVNDLFVPDRYCFEIGRIRNEYPEYPIGKVPFEAFARLCMTAAMLGMVSGLCRHLQAEFEDNKRILDFSHHLKQETKEHFHQVLTYARRIYQDPEQPEGFPPGGIGKEIYDDCCSLFYSEGLRIADEESLSHYAWRDLMLASQHFMLK